MVVEGNQSVLKNLLLIFYRNPELGKVKTRLAATIGDDRALAIYYRLAAHTREVTTALLVDCRVCYSNFVDREDAWDNARYQKVKQEGADLGDKMQHAFQAGFRDGYRHICIIGTDCLELTNTIIQDAFRKLHEHDAVLGPARDGGYYLLGLQTQQPRLFQQKQWSTNTVLQETINDLQEMKLSVALLPVLRDVDEEGDLPRAIR